MNKRRAFTLVELLVVLAIIAVLLSILLPSLAIVRDQAKATVCLSNMNQWGKIAFMYAADHDNRFMSYNWNGGMWMYSLRRYYSNDKLRLCPAATKPASEGGGKGPFVAWGKLDATWGATQGYYGSYGMNGWWYQIPEGYKDLWGYSASWFWKNTTVPNASNIPLFLDCTWVDSWPKSSDQAPKSDTEPPSARGSSMGRFCTNRHRSKINSVFLDTSVRSVGLKELWVLQWNPLYDFELVPSNEKFPPWMEKFKYYPPPGGRRGH